MRYLQGVDRSQTMLFPSAVDEYVTGENPVRAIDAFVEGVDLEELGIVERQESDAGAPGYHPRVFLKLFVYGYLNRIRSSRELERAAKRNVEVIWLLQKLTPDHWTINQFRKDHRNAFKSLFRQFNVVCGSLGLFGADVVAIDGTHLKAVNSPERNITKAKVQELIKEVDKKTEAYLEALETADKEAAAQSIGKTDAKALKEKIANMEAERKRCEELLAMLAESKTGQISHTDADSRMLKKNGQSVVGYNAQVAADTKHHLVAAEKVTQEASDWNLLEPMASEAKAALEVEKLQAIADTGYCCQTQIEACLNNGIEPTVPEKKERVTGEGKHPLSSFRYDAEKDCYHCPTGKELLRHQDSERHGNLYRIYYSTSACKNCPLLAECTKGAYRKLSIPVKKEFMTAMKERLKAKPELMRLRSQTVEHIFGTIKFWWGYRSFLCRGIEAVQAEFSLATLAYNFRRALNILGASALFAGIRRLQTT